MSNATFIKILSEGFSLEGVRPFRPIQSQVLDEKTGKLLVLTSRGMREVDPEAMIEKCHVDMAVNYWQTKKRFDDEAKRSLCKEHDPDDEATRSLCKEPDPDGVREEGTDKSALDLPPLQGAEKARERGRDERGKDERGKDERGKDERGKEGKRDRGDTPRADEARNREGILAFLSSLWSRDGVDPADETVPLPTVDELWLKLEPAPCEEETFDEKPADPCPGVSHSQSGSSKGKDPSRHVPADAKLWLEARYGGFCATKECPNRAKILHHVDRWALKKCHDPRHMFPLCKPCEGLVHEGLFEDEEKLHETDRVRWERRMETEKDKAKARVDEKVKKYRQGGS